MKIFVLALLGCCLAASAINFQPVARGPSRETFQPVQSVRTLRQQPQGYNYPSPNPPFNLPSPGQFVAQQPVQFQPQPVPQQQIFIQQQQPVPLPAPAPQRPVVLPAPVAPPPPPPPAPLPQPAIINVQPVPTTPPNFYIPPQTTPRPTLPPTQPPTLPPRPPTFAPVTLPPPPPPRPVVPPPAPVIPVPPPAPVVPVPPPAPVVPAPPPRPVQPVVVDPIPPQAPTQVNPMALMPQLPNVQMPQIVNLDVSCAKDSMIVRIRFDQVFNGVIYAKGFHNNLACHYVPFNSGRDSYEFTVRLDTCGTQFVNEFSSGGKAYLESVIVLQNEQDIQEIWDTARNLRCLWEGSLQQQVSYSLSVDMLDSQVVSFSGDTANVFMEVQVGKGPFAPTVNGLVKIGETLTMVVSVEGDPDFDVHVKDCVAHDGNRNNPILLTDNRGCVLKKKLMGPWQKTRQTNSNTVSIMAYSFFQAFKFPDTPEIFLECNVELCKSQCDICPEDAGLFDVRSNRVRRGVNATAVADVHLAQRLRVVADDDLELISLTNGEL